MPAVYPQALAALLIGLIGFGLARYFQFQVRVSILIWAAVSGATFISGGLNFAKTALEVWKLKREVEKLGRESRDEGRMVQLPTLEETQKFGVSILERKLDIYCRLEGEKERIEAKSFIARVNRH